MERIISLLVDFEELDKHVRNSNINYREAIVDFYKSVGKKHGFTVRENTSVIRNGINFGKLDLVWLEPNIVFAIEFGNLDNLLAKVWRIVEFSPNMAVLILSSKSMIRIENVINLIEKSEMFGNLRKRFLVLDVSEKKIIKEP
ncbi:MAG TPA: hypothetical protein EYP86_01245 [Candidatus Altiarchaeales archaeon]|nr:hypothetical protein [Candidatus Altiarchaeales archaeon]